jgi:serine/threonine-protein kinase
MEGTAVGTAPYMSPEQVEGKIVDARSDVFSFGAVLYELLSGTRAFGGNTTAQVLSAVLRDTPRPIAASPLARIAGRCLEKDPVRRYQTMGEVRAALENVVRERSDSEASVAVLPFADLSPGKDQEWFRDGLAEEIINALTRIPDLKVIARTSAFAFKGKNEDVRRIGDALGVSTILEGSVRQAGQRIRVTAQLVRAADGSHVWSERYDRDLADVFAVQDEIATAITSALQVKLAGTLVPGRRHTPNLTAYDHYLKGIYDAGQWTPESMARARTHFERALDLDPQFAVAHAEYAHLFFRFAINGIMPPREALPLVRREARRALAIDPSLPEGHAMLGAVAAMFDYDWEEAEQQFRLALATTATPAYVHRWFAHFYLLPLGRCDEAVAHHTIGLKDDPINTTARSERAVCLDAAGRHAEAVAELRAVIELAESYWFPYFILGCRHMLDGDLHDALGPAERCYRLAPWFLPGVGLLAALFERLGETQRASTLVPQLSSDDSYAEPLGLGMYHLLRGDLDQAAAFAEKAIDHRQPAAFFFLRVHASALRSSRHWTRLAGMTNLPL